MQDIELNSPATSGNSSSSYRTPSGAGDNDDEGADRGSRHSSLRSIGSRMRAIGRLFLRSNTCLELLTTTAIFVGYCAYWVIFRSLACLYLVSDCPATIKPFSHPSCAYPQPIGGNTRWRPCFMLSKILAFSSMTYLLFIVGNLGQLELYGRYQVSGTCVLALTNCKANFVICDETANLSKAEFNLINSILKRNFFAFFGTRN